MRTWNISSRQRAQIIRFIDTYHPQTTTEIRNKKILQYAFVDDMCASNIARLGDPDLISTSNRSMGKPLSVTSILRIIHDYFPKLEKGKEWNTKNKEQRLEIMKKRRERMIPSKMQCAKCGATDNLELHHMIPLSFGGTNDDANLVYLCNDCHSVVTAYQRRLTYSESAIRGR